MDGELYLTDIDTNFDVSKKLPPRGRVQIFNHNFWRKTIQRVNNLKDQDYYEGKKIKPGMNFFKILLESYEQPSPSIESIRINLPETICMQSNRYNIIYSRQRSLHRMTEASFQQFQKMVVPVECTSHRENRESCPLEGSGLPISPIQMLRCCPDYPIFISRSSSGTSFMKHVVTATEYKMKQLPTNQNELYQRYIVPYDFRANLIRLHFFTKNSRTQQRSFAYKIVNVSPMFSVQERKTLGSHNFTVNFDRENSFKYLVVKGRALEPYEKMAESIVMYLEHCKEVVIREIVFDFTMDYFKTAWLVGLKMIRFDNKTMQPHSIQQRTRKMQQITFSVTCRLCGVFFHKDSVRKTLTYKLLYQLMQHLRKRNLNLPDIKVNESSTIYCRVCDLCYKLAVAEHKLINIEQEFSIAQNVIMEEQIERVGLRGTSGAGGVVGRQRMLQWRMMVYLEQINDLQGHYVEDAQKIFLQFRIQSHKSKFELTLPPNSTHRSKPSYYNESTWDFTKTQEQNIPNYTLLPIKKVKVEYFFSNSQDISSFLNEVEIKFRLTYSQDWNDLFAQGSSKTINHFKNRMKHGQRHSNEVLMFFQNKKYARLQLHMGLICDGYYSTQGLTLSQTDGVFFPIDKYYNCNPFPEVWMEIFQHEGMQIDDKTTSNDGNTVSNEGSTVRLARLDTKTSGLDMLSPRRLKRK